MRPSQPDDARRGHNQGNRHWLQALPGWAAIRGRTMAGREDGSCSKDANNQGGRPVHTWKSCKPSSGWWWCTPGAVVAALCLRCSWTMVYFGGAHKGPWIFFFLAPLLGWVGTVSAVPAGPRISLQNLADGKGAGRSPSPSPRSRFSPPPVPLSPSLAHPFALSC